MPLARIVASNPAAARYTARTLHEAGYDVEIVPHGSPANPSVELEFDVDADKMISLPTEKYVPGEREFVLKPLWRKFTAKNKADEDVKRAQLARRNWSPAQRERYEAARVAAAAVVQRREESRIDRAMPEARETALAAAEQQRQAAEQVRHAAEEVRRAEELRAQRMRDEQEAAHQRAIEEQRVEQRVEQRRQEQARQLELARKQEYEEQQMILRKQEEERQRAEVLRRQRASEVAEAARHMQLAQEREAARQAQVAQEREARMRQEALQRQAEEQHRDDVIRQRREEELSRRAEAQRLLLEANQRREESMLERVSEPAIAAASAGSVPTLREYFALRKQQWHQSRAARPAKSKTKVTRIDLSGRSAWRQAWPITAGVAAACLIGWGIAAYNESAPQSVQAPPILAPGQYAPYPVANPPASTAAKKTAARPQAKPKPSAVHRAEVADDEVVVHHYYPSKVATAQNGTPQRPKRITDLQ